MTTQIENKLLSCRFTGEEQVIYYLSLAIEYDLKYLKSQLQNVSFNKCFTCVKAFDGFERLDMDTKVLLLKKRLEIVMNNCGCPDQNAHVGRYGTGIGYDKVTILDFVSELAKKE